MMKQPKIKTLNIAHNLLSGVYYGVVYHQYCFCLLSKKPGRYRTESSNGSTKVNVPFH